VGYSWARLWGDGVGGVRGLWVKELWCSRDTVRRLLWQGEFDLGGRVIGGGVDCRLVCRDFGLGVVCVGWVGDF